MVKPLQTDIRPHDNKQLQRCGQPLAAYTTIPGLLQKGPETPTAIYSADQDATILAIVASGASIGLVKETDTQQAEKQGKVIIWPGDYLELDLSFIYKRKRLQDPLIKAISGIIRQIWLPEQT